MSAFLRKRRDSETILEYLHTWSRSDLGLLVVTARGDYTPLTNRSSLRSVCKYYQGNEKLGIHHHESLVGDDLMFNIISKETWSLISPFLL